MSELEMSSITSLTVNKAIEQLSNAYSKVINANIPVKMLPSVMLWGPPGVGKSQGIRQLAKDLETNTSKKVHITDVRLLLFNPIDLRGIPTSNADKTLAVWLKPQIFQMDESDDVINILFLDEISAAPSSVQAAAYQITLDRVIGEHKLPDNCIVIAAGNRVTDKSVAFKMPKALANRLCHFDIQSNFGSWREWAVKSGINPKVVGFLSFRPSHLMCADNGSEMAFTTPRSWEMVSNILNYVSDDLEETYPMIAGCVGVAVAVEFKTWCKVFNSLPNIKDIFNGLMPPAPTSTDVMYALVSSMVDYARGCMNDMTKIANSIKYSMQLPPDFASVLLKDYMLLKDDFREKMMVIPEFSRWLQKNGKYFNNGQ